MTSIVPEYEKYGSPAKLAGDSGLSHAKKVELLGKWRDDENALIRASAEGLNGGEDNNLRDVLKALKELMPEDKLNNIV